MIEIQNILPKIRKLLLKNTVMSVKQLCQKLDDRHRSSVFRDLKKISVISSYTHAGQFHALNEAAKFDKNGLWFFQDVGFSQHGTLKKTLEHVISDSSMGMTHKETKKLFRVDVQKPLTDLVNTNVITRQLLPSRIYVYLSNNENKEKRQLTRRLAISGRTLDITLPPESVRIEILIEIIQNTNRTLDEKILGPLLRKRGITIKNDEVVYVLTYYDIKKNGF